MKPVDLPANYTFDLKIIGESKDYKGKKNDMTILMSKSKGIIGLITTDNGKESMVIFDADKDVMAIYSEEDGKKQVYGMPSVMSLGASMAEAQQEDMSIEQTGKTKKVAGYQCNEWIIEDETSITKAYVAEDFPASYAKAFSKLFQSTAPTLKNELMDGMCLKSETRTKKKNKKSSFNTKEVILGDVTISNTDYEKVDINSGK